MVVQKRHNVVYAVSEKAAVRQDERDYLTDNVRYHRLNDPDDGFADIQVFRFMSKEDLGSSLCSNTLSFVLKIWIRRVIFRE